MKPLKYISLVAIAFLCFQCSSDDNSSDLVQDSTLDDFLLGDWTIKEMSIQGNITANDLNNDWGWWFSPYPIPVIPTIEAQNYSVSFSDLPNKISSNGIIAASYKANIYDYVSNYTVSKDIENIDFFKEGNWKYKSDISDIITINRNSQIEDYFITKISENEFVLQKQLKDDILLTSYETTVPSTATLDVWIKFKKI